MTTQVFAFGNNINTPLTAAINASVTTIPVTSTAGFPTIPSGSYLALTLIHPPTTGIFEVVWVTAVSGLNLTVLRGQEGSTAQSWASGDTIFSDVTQGILQNFNNVIQQNSFNVGGADSGVVNAYVVACNPIITAYTDGMKVYFRPANTNTGSSTLDAGAGPKYIVQGATTLAGYEILATVLTEVTYDATNQQWLLGSGAVRQLVQPGAFPFQATNLSQLGALPTGMKNRIINGAMSFDQRNGGASGTASQYTVDRWFFGASQSGKGTWGQSLNAITPPPNQTAYLGFQSSSAYSIGTSDNFSIFQAIEAWNVADFGWGTSSAKTVTLSFWVYSSLTGAFGGCLKNYASTRSYPFAYFVNSANTWTYITIVVPGDTGGSWVLTGTGGSIYLQFSLGVGTTYQSTAYSWQNGNYFNVGGTVSVVGTNGATFYLTGVQLEVGSVATQFDLRADSVEFDLCLRYYETLPTSRIQGITYQPNGDTRCYVPWAKAKRVAPTVTYTGTTSVIAQGPGGVAVNVSLGSLTVGAVYGNGAQISLIGGYASFSGCGSVFSWGDNGSGALTFYGSAEL